MIKDARFKNEMKSSIPTTKAALHKNFLQEYSLIRNLELDLRQILVEY